MSSSRSSRSSSRPRPELDAGGWPASPPPALTRRDRTVVAALLLLLAAIGGAISVPASPGTATSAGSDVATATGAGSDVAAAGAASDVAATGTTAPSSSAAEPDIPVIRHGILGAAATVNPLTAATRAERDLTALVFSGLVRLGAGDSVDPDLASSWKVSDDGGTWDFVLRDDARWHDGEPVTAGDVVFTVDVLQDPAYAGPAAGSWSEVTASALDEQTVRFELGTPIAGFIEAARQPILPSHLLADVPIAGLASHPSWARPVGAGPYRLASLDDSRALLELAVVTGSTAPTPTPTPTPSPSGAIATPPRPEPDRPPDRPANLEIRFFDDARSLAEAWAAGDVDVANGLSPELARQLGERGDTRLLRYPTTVLTMVILNVRPTHPELRDPATRRALLQAIDRRSLIGEAWAGAALVADAPIPPSSWAFDPAASKPVRYDRRGAAAALAKAGWVSARSRWFAPRAAQPYSIEILSSEVATNPAGFTAGAAVAADLASLGMDASHVPLPPAELVGERMRRGAFAAAVIDVNVGLDPDLYPLLASSQTTSRGLNLGGVVDAELDRLLAAARKPAPEKDRVAAYRALQERLASHQYVLPLAFREELVLVRDTMSGVTPRLITDAGDRFHDVLAWRLAAGR